MNTAGIITTLMRQVECLRDEHDELLIENEELRQLALGEIEFFAALSARWAEHLRPQNGRERPCQPRW
jgi:hypothetical protein